MSELPDIPEVVEDAISDLISAVCDREHGPLRRAAINQGNVERARDALARLFAESLQATKPDAVAVERADYQQRVDAWMQTCFGPEISGDKQERNWRFGEEALELLQSLGCTKNDAVKLVDYVYDRPQGDINQEVGGVMVTLAALCTAAGFDMTAEGERELSRVWTKVEKIRAKHAAKILRQPLPGPSIPAARSQP